MALDARAVLANQGFALKFLDAPNQWCFFGGVVPPGETARMDKLTLGQGPRVLVSAADDHCIDLDSYFLENGNFVRSDEDADAIPILEHFAQNGSDYSHMVKNVKANGAALVVTVILSK